MLRYPLVPSPITVLGRKLVALLVKLLPNKIAVDNTSADRVLIVAGRFGTPMLLSETFGLRKDTEPFVRDVNTKPVEKGLLLLTSYAKILRKAIESVSYVFLELELIYFGL